MNGDTARSTVASQYNEAFEKLTAGLTEMPEHSSPVARAAQALPLASVLIDVQACLNSLRTLSDMVGSLRDYPLQETICGIAKRSFKVAYHPLCAFSMEPSDGECGNLSNRVRVLRIVDSAMSVLDSLGLAPRVPRSENGEVDSRLFSPTDFQSVCAAFQAASSQVCSISSADSIPASTIAARISDASLQDKLKKYQRLLEHASSQQEHFLATPLADSHEPSDYEANMPLITLRTLFTTVAAHISTNKTAVLAAASLRSCSSELEAMLSAIDGMSDTLGSLSAKVTQTTESLMQR